MWRMRLEGLVPQNGPTINFCSAVSVPDVIPLEVFELATVGGSMPVPLTKANEEFVTFAGQVEHPDAREVIVRGTAGRAHA